MDKRYANLFEILIDKLDSESKIISYSNSKSLSLLILSNE